MDVSVAKPFIYVSAANLWDDVTLVVFGIIPPSSGQAKPTLETIATIVSNTPQPKPIQLVVENGAFKHHALSFAVTAAAADIGTVTISISRDEDPVQADLTRPVHKTIELTRSAPSSPTFIMRTFALVGK